MGLDPDDQIVQEAKERFELAESWESDARANYMFDTKFANGDSSNNYQWDAGVASARAMANLPCLTVNKTMQFCLHVINDQRQNPSQVEIRPVGSGASVQSARVLEGIVRHIEYQSQAQNAYNNAAYGQVIGGIGYWRIITDYCDPASFDQEIYIERIADPLSVYLDCDIATADGSDANWAIVFKDMPRDQFELQYPDEADDEGGLGSASPLGAGSHNDEVWDSEEHVRVCEYFCKRYETDKLYLLPDGRTILRSEAKQAGVFDAVRATALRKRDVEVPKVDWYLIGAGRIIDRKEWPGKYIPIVRVVGTETVIDKTLDRFGMTRSLIDPQRIYNHFTSACVEQVSLQPKSPFLAPVEAISGFEDYWANANLDSKAYLPYRSLDEQGNPIPKPERSEPPVMSQAFLEGLRNSAQEMMMVSGIYEANLGERTNDVSGKAIDARQRQGAMSTYHFISRFADAIRFTGRILVDLIPKVYDTPRVIKILAESGDHSMVHIDPNAPQAHQQVQDPNDAMFDENAIQSIYNPNVGTYEVIASIGPNYETRRQETFNAVSEILVNNKELTPIIGDILMDVADFPMADALAKRMKNMVPPKALGVPQPDPIVQQLQQNMAAQHQVMQNLQDELKHAKDKAANADAERIISQYKAETDRMGVVGKIDPDALRPVIRQLVSEALGSPINPIIAAHAFEAAQMHPTVQNPNPPPGQILPGQPDPNAQPVSAG